MMVSLDGYSFWYYSELDSEGTLWAYAWVTGLRSSPGVGSTAAFWLAVDILVSICCKG